MSSIISKCLLTSVVLVLAGCATTTTTDASLPAQLTSLCSVAQPQIAAFVAISGQLSSTAQTALSTAQSAVNVVCAPGVVASSDSIAQLTETVLPSLTIIAGEAAGLLAN